MLGRILAIVLGVAGVLAGSQAPNFTAHFMQNLEGRVDELGQLADNINSDRERIGFTRNMAKAACAEAETQLQKDDCDRAEETLVRFDTLMEMKQELEATNKWQRPLVLAQSVMSNGMAREFAKNAMEQYEPAVPTTPEGAGYAAGGGGILWGIGRALFGLIGAPFRRRY